MTEGAPPVLTSCGTWMKAKVYSVAWGGSTRGENAGGSGARRLGGSVSFCGDTGGDSTEGDSRGDTKGHQGHHGEG